VSWRRNLFVMWICQFIAMLGMSLVIPFLPLFVRELGITDVNETAKWSGFVFSGPFVLSFFLVPFWGYLGDKYGRKLMVIRAIFGLALAQLFIGFSQNVYQLLAARLVQGAISGFLPASLALISTTTPKEKTGYALGILQTATSAGTVLGPFFGGTLADTIGIRPIFYLVAGICSLSGLLVISLVRENKIQEDTQKKFSVRHNLNYIFQFKQLKILLLLIVIAQTGVGFIQPLFALYVETLNIDKNYLATTAGVLYGIMGIFTVIAAPFWGKLSEKFQPRKLLMTAAIIGSICYASHFFLHNPIPVIIVRAFLGFALGGILPIIYTLVSHNTPLDRRGGILGFASSSQILGNLLGPTLSGLFALQYGVRLGFIISGGIFFLVGLISLRNVKEES